LVADVSKWTRNAAVRVVPFNKVNCLFTDRLPDGASIKTALKEAGLEVVVCEDDGRRRRSGAREGRDPTGRNIACTRLRNGAPPLRWMLPAGCRSAPAIKTRRIGWRPFRRAGGRAG